MIMLIIAMLVFILVMITMTMTVTMVMVMDRIQHYRAGEPKDQQPQHRGHLRLAENGEA